MTKAQATKLIRTEAFGPKTASILGRMAHRILDYVILPSGYVCTCTPTRGWDYATPRELHLLRRA